MQAAPAPVRCGAGIVRPRTSGGTIRPARKARTGDRCTRRASMKPTSTVPLQETLMRRLTGALLVMAALTAVRQARGDERHDPRVVVDRAIKALGGEEKLG